ncbi:MAG: hypothetical protein LUF87_06555 [Alistipes sp.]|nr:hypothetical protein [Alistipes sp.]
METKQEELQEQPELQQPEQRRRRGAACKGFRRYFYDFLVVVCGIAVTFMVNGWINSGKERRVVNSHLEAVKHELRDNLEYILARTAYYEKVIDFADYLNSRDKAVHDPELVWEASYFQDGWSIMEVFSNLKIETSAFESMKTSGAMNLMGDQELMRALIKCYTELVSAKEAVDAVEDRKFIIAQTAETHPTPSGRGTDILHPAASELYVFYSNPFRLDITLTECAEILQNTLSMF